MDENLIELEDIQMLLTWRNSILSMAFMFDSSTISLPHIPYNVNEIERELVRRDYLKDFNSKE